MTMLSAPTGQRLGDARCLSLSVNSGAHGVNWVVAEGNLNRTKAPLLRAFLDTRCAPRERPVRIDFSGVRCCDAAGLRVLIEFDARLSPRGDQLVVVNPCPTMRLLIDVLHANRLVFHVNPARPFAAADAP